MSLISVSRYVSLLSHLVSPSLFLCLHLCIFPVSGTFSLPTTPPSVSVSAGISNLISVSLDLSLSPYPHNHLHLFPQPLSFIKFLASLCVFPPWSDPSLWPLLLFGLSQGLSWILLPPLGQLPALHSCFQAGGYQH
ncbi:hypothetical protein H1C71_011041 [Ictidomys tridecemlineatus]|nr:hypothetical protein H1C71_011041 [Ictidomys tridecemlineatus]